MKGSQNSYFMVEWAKESFLFQSSLFRVGTVILKSLVTYIHQFSRKQFFLFILCSDIYRVLQTIQMKIILLYVWAERAVLGSAKTALKSS